MAVINKNPTIVEALLEAGTNVNAIDNKSQTALPVAATIGHDALDISKLLFAKPKVDMNVQDSNIQTPLHCSACSENDGNGTVKALFEKNADVEKLDINQRAPCIQLHTIAKLRFWQFC